MTGIDQPVIREFAFLMQFSESCCIQSSATIVSFGSSPAVSVHQWKQIHLPRPIAFS
jgi:hypothetical protein